MSGGHVCPGASIAFTSTSAYTSTDPLTYAWNFGDGTPVQVGYGAAMSSTSHSFTTARVYAVALTVTTTSGVHDTLTQLVSIEKAVASFAVNATNAIAPATIAFTSTSLITATGPISYVWDFGDGSPLSVGATYTTAHYYSLSGIYPVTLTVTPLAAARASPTRRHSASRRWRRRSR